MTTSARVVVVGGCGIDYVIRAEPTGTTMICVDAQGQKQTPSRPGANHALMQTHVHAELLNRATVLLAQLEIPLETVLHAGRLAHDAG